MLYHILRVLVTITFQFFFKRLRITGKARIPEQGPVIICANHPGSFLDPIVIATSINRKLYFLAKGEVFRSSFAKWMLPKLNMIPVYRKQDNPDLMHKNEETFEQCYEHLNNGGAIIIFPEGVSVTEWKVKPLKTGAARIALGAVKKYGANCRVKISCIGINYDDPHTFRKDAFLSVAEAIDVVDYDNSDNDKEQVKALTDEIAKRLTEQVVHVRDDQEEQVVRAIERLYKGELLLRMGVSSADLSQQWQLTQRISEIVAWYKDHEPQRFSAFATAVSSYFWKLEQLRLSDKAIRATAEGRVSARRYLLEWLFILIGFPFYVYGLLHNYLPFFTATYIADKKVKQREFKGAVGAAGGMFLFLIWYGFGAWLSHLYFDSFWWWLLYLLSWPLSGMWAWYYYRSIRAHGKKWIILTVLRKRKQLLQELIAEREELLSEIKSAERQFNALTPLS